MTIPTITRLWRTLDGLRTLMQLTDDELKTMGLERIHLGETFNAIEWWVNKHTEGKRYAVVIDPEDSNKIICEDESLQSYTDTDYLMLRVDLSFEDAMRAMS